MLRLLSFGQYESWGREFDDLSRLRKAYAEGDLTWQEVVTSLEAWSAHAAHGTTWRLRGEVFRNAPVIRGTAALASGSPQPGPSPGSLLTAVK